MTDFLTANAVPFTILATLLLGAWIAAVAGTEIADHIGVDRDLFEDGHDPAGATLEDRARRAGE